jgi:hypothetical protein
MNLRSRIAVPVPETTGCAKITVSNRCRFTCKHDQFALGKTRVALCHNPQIFVPERVWAMTMDQGCSFLSFFGS